MNELINFTILFRIHNSECPIINDDMAPVGNELNYLYTNGFIDIKNNNYVIAEKGKGLMKQFCALLDQVAKFQIFSNVIIDSALPSDIKKDDAFVLDYVHDPRFVDEGGEDLRVAMMQYFHESCMRAGQKLPPVDFNKAIYLQNLFYNTQNMNYDFWFNLKVGLQFKEANEIYANGFHLKDFAEDYDEAFDTASNIYRAGILEDIKRYGRRCENCDSPVGVYDSKAEVTQCPNPYCRSNNISESQSVAYSDEDLVMYEVYEYEPYVYYHPYDPCLDAFAFGVLCGVLI